MKLELLKSWSGNVIIPELPVLVLTKTHMDSGNEIAYLTTIQFIEVKVEVTSGGYLLSHIHH